MPSKGPDVRLGPLPNPRPAPEARDDAFFAALAATCSVTVACRAAEISRSAVYARRANDPEYAARWAEAWMLGVGTLEDEATRRAVEGAERPIYYKGVKVGSLTEYSDQLMMHRLQAELPEKYRQNKHAIEHSGPGGGPVRIDVSQLSTAQIMAILAADGEGGAEGGAGEAEPGE